MLIRSAIACSVVLGLSPRLAAAPPPTTPHQPGAPGVVRGDAPGRLSITIQIEDEPEVIELRPHSIRAPGFSVIAVGELGPAVLAIPAPRTVRGHVRDRPESMLAGGFDPEGRLTAILWMDAADPDAPLYQIQPDPQTGELVVARVDSLGIPGVCGVTDRHHDPHGIIESEHHGDGTPGIEAIGDPFVATVAFDVDNPLYTRFGSDLDNTIAQIETLFNAVATVYERDTAIIYQLGDVIVRTSSSTDPYSGTDGGGLLSQMRDHWNTVLPSVDRDLAHLLSGRNFDGAVVGVAFVGVVCTSSAYGVNQWLDGFSGLVGLLAHEMGHNWSAAHCNADPECRIMCSGLGGCSGLGNPVRFAPGPIAQVQSHASTRTCLDPVVLPLPIADTFDERTIDTSLWIEQAGAQTFPDPRAPTQPRALWLGSDATLRSFPFAATLPTGDPIALRFAVRDQLLPDGARLHVDVQRFSRWVTLATIPVELVRGGYRPFTFSLPDQLSAAAPGAVRFRTGPSPTSTFWVIDDLDIARGISAGPASMPLVDGFETGALFLEHWNPQSDAAPSPFSPLVGGFSLRIGDGQAAETNLLRAASIGSSVELSMIALASSATTDIALSFLDDEGRWIEFTTLMGSEFLAPLPVTLSLPVVALHDGLRIRLAASGSAWSVDDLAISRTPRCSADLTSQANPGVPDGTIDAEDFFFYLDLFARSSLIADLTGADDQPDGVLDAADFFRYLDLFAAGCL